MGVPEPHIGRVGPFGQFLLFRHVDADADQMRRAAGLMNQFRPRPQPHPMSIVVAHAEFLINGRNTRFQHPFGDRK